MLFTNATVVTMNPTRDIITNGAVAVQGNRIVAVGKADVLQRQYDGDERVDVQGKLIIPGLIDTHVHLAQALIRGCADDMALIEWLCDRVWVLQGNFTEDDGYVSARLCIAEMLKSGTTTFLESMLAHRYGFNGIAQAVEESGIRACLAGIVMDIGTYATQTNSMHPGMIEDRETSLLGVLDMHSKWEDAACERIHVWFGPRTPGGVTSELYREMS
ncbi:MAG: amidohydrolase, partial [Chloroflexi bacterium]